MSGHANGGTVHVKLVRWTTANVPVAYAVRKILLAAARFTTCTMRLRILSGPQEVQLRQ